MARRLNYITIQLAPDHETSVDEAIQSQSLFLKVGFRLNAGRIVGHLSENDKKSPDLGKIWHDVLPKDGRYVFEMATEVPYYLPNVEDRPEFTIEVGDSKFFVCNRMVRAFLGEGAPKEDGLSYVLVHLRALPSLVEEHGYSGLHPLPTKSFVSTQFACESESAEQAIEEHYYSWQDEFFRKVSRVIDCFRISGPHKFENMFPHVSVASFPVLWLAVEGADQEKGCEQFCTHVGMVAFRPMQNLDSSAKERLEGLLRGDAAIESYESALALARTYAHYGYKELAIVHLCTACETFLSMRIRSLLCQRHLSREHMETYFDSEVTFSQLLNLHVPALFDLSELSDFRRVLGDVNSARKIRNEVLHRGRVPSYVSGKRIEEMLKSGADLIHFMVPDGTSSDDPGMG